jgi:phosphohistidine phosphatase
MTASGAASSGGGDAAAIRTLVLLRHARADTPPGTPDEQRPLSTGGRADARAAGAWLATRHLPEVVLCSPARRTCQTWQAMADALPVPPELVRYERLLYLGGVGDLLGLVWQIDETVGTVLVIGHNPAMSQLSYTLHPTNQRTDGGLRTCGLAVHRVIGPWSACGPGRAPLTATHTARGDG